MPAIDVFRQFPPKMIDGASCIAHRFEKRLTDGLKFEQLPEIE